MIYVVPEAGRVSPVTYSIYEVTPSMSRKEESASRISSSIFQEANKVSESPNRTCPARSAAPYVECKTPGLGEAHLGIGQLSSVDIAASKNRPTRTAAKVKEDTLIP